MISRKVGPPFSRARRAARSMALCTSSQLIPSTLSPDDETIEVIQGLVVAAEMLVARLSQRDRKGVRRVTDREFTLTAYVKDPVDNQTVKLKLQTGLA